MQKGPRATPASMVERALEAFGMKARVGYPSPLTMRLQPLLDRSSGPCMDILSRPMPSFTFLRAGGVAAGQLS